MQTINTRFGAFHILNEERCMGVLTYEVAPAFKTTDGRFARPVIYRPMQVGYGEHWAFANGEEWN